MTRTEPTRGGPPVVGRAGTVTGGGLRGALAFEWTKLWSVRATWWNLLIGVVLAVGFGAMLGLSADASAQKGLDVALPAPHVAAQGITVAQLTVVVLATLALTGEYTGGSIRSTLQSVPVRGRMLLAKTAVVGGVVAVVGAVLFSLPATLAAAGFMGDLGAYTSGEAAGTALGVGTYLALLAVMAVGTGALLRSGAGTITTLIMVLMALPELTKVVGADWLVRVGAYMPSVAGEVLMTHRSEPYGGGTALVVLLAWAAAALGGGYAALRSRDA
ncbi:ABC transporter [Streptomyces sp. DSM 42041]|uniref:ABC transporter n=1 Tax=Streptomyces hazeniae TaxID=3075538 RepID=A0ABU2NMB8_9ACTN|nr:ABC transporter [Streptomyces sp. DSM 42041]MDT0377736.1 ABC transporter [Streptomyces sp. DSM 42041]